MSYGLWAVGCGLSTVETNFHYRGTQGGSLLTCVVQGLTLRSWLISIDRPLSLGPSHQCFRLDHALEDGAYLSGA